MRNFSPAFQAHIEQECTTLCWAWKLTRKDDVVLGFTDHDQTLEVDGLVYEAASGFAPTDMENRLGFALDNGAVLGGLSSENITKTDVEAGLYDTAGIEILRVNWKAPEEHGVIWGGTIGDIHLKDGQIEAELLGRSAVLERSTGRVFSRQCDAVFGDGRCGLDLNGFPSGTVCPHTFLACRDQFENVENFRGFPYLIGDDASYAAPREGELKDGSSRYSL